ncbi:hypothetical protein V5F77_24710 [Xanthobacter sp. DSM 24535]|uniref:hypothetical protein n=1 Tax=Roseixanthobacter psychrophilus TaxID=3119917 RepID=UPI00372B5D1F
MISIGVAIPSLITVGQLGLDPAAAAILSRYPVAPTDDLVRRMDAGCRILRPAGVLDAQDGLWATGVHDRASARLNLVRWTGTVTNLIPNSTMQGADVAANTAPTGWSTVTGSTGLTRSIVGVGTVGGLPYVDMRVSGTLLQSGPVLAFNWAPTSATPAVAGGRYTHGVYLALTAGTFGTTQGAVNLLTIAADGTTTVDNASGPNVFGGLTATLAQQQLTMVAGATAAQIVPRLRMTFGASGTVVDFTLRIAAPQLVRMDVPGTFIPTSGSSASQVQTLYRFDLTEYLGVTWTAGAPGAPGGFTGNGTTGYLDTNANPSVDFTRMSLNAACYGAWTAINTTSNGSILGDAAGAAGVVYIRPRDPGGGVIGRINSGSGFGIDIADARGLTVLNRTGPTAAQIYKNGVNIFQAAPASSTMPTTLHLLRQSIYYPGQISAAFAGASLTPSQHLATYQGIGAIMGVAA